jgi:pyruvate dehydrogenase E2 component (dihydrolipoamide acetyltransferase)
MWVTTVKKGDILAEIETDKATMELESYKSGTLLYIGAKQGEKIAVNELLCIIGEKGKVDVDAIVNAAQGTGEQSTSEKAQETSDLPTGQTASNRQPVRKNSPRESFRTFGVNPSERTTSSTGK